MSLSSLIFLPASLGINGTKSAYVPPHLRASQRAASSPSSIDGCAFISPFFYCHMSHQRSGAAGTTPGLLHLSLVVVMVEEVTLEIEPQMDMCLHLEGAVATITGRNVPTTAITVVVELPGTSLDPVNHLVSVFGEMANISSEDAMCALRRSSTAMPKIPPNSTLASTLKSMMISPSKRPVLVSLIPLPPSRVPP